MKSKDETDDSDGNRRLEILNNVIRELNVFILSSFVRESKSLCLIISEKRNHSHIEPYYRARDIKFYNRFYVLLEHGYKYDEELNRLYDEPLPPDSEKYIPRK